MSFVCGEGGTYEDDRFYDWQMKNGITDMAGLYVCLHSLSVRPNLPEKSRSRSLATIFAVFAIMLPWRCGVAIMKY
jgi:hypothetical protein